MAGKGFVRLSAGRAQTITHFPPLFLARAGWFGTGRDGFAGRGAAADRGFVWLDIFLAGVIIRKISRSMIFAFLVRCCWRFQMCT